MKEFSACKFKISSETCHLNTVEQLYSYSAENKFKFAR